jgi:hypothetical protein
LEVQELKGSRVQKLEGREFQRSRAQKYKDSKVQSGMKVESFEDLLAWSKARELVNKIYSVTKRERFSRDKPLVYQVRRAAISVMSNISEGFENSCTLPKVRAERSDATSPSPRIKDILTRKSS